MMYDHLLSFAWWTEDQRLYLIRQVRSKIYGMHLEETGCPPPPRLLRIRSLSTILSAIGASWTDSLQQIAAKWQLAEIEEVLCLAAEKIYNYDTDFFFLGRSFFNLHVSFLPSVQRW